ncbi:MAG: nuclear transport factor 2 family protein, partial [Acidimicrobiia bacterium]|nr:nuclear transport factor 2 family protein [Acidimicrobiia bacterium]
GFSTSTTRSTSGDGSMTRLLATTRSSSGMSRVGSPSPRTTAETLYAAFAQGAIEVVLELLDPDITWELVGPAEIPYFGRYEGVTEVRRFFDLLGTHCVVEAFEVNHLTETATGVVAEGFERGRFAGHSDTYDMRWCHVMTMSQGHITTFTDYLDTAPMLAAWRSREP